MNTFLASANIMGDSMMTGLILLVVVFAALIALSAVIGLFGKASEGTSSKESAPKAMASAARPMPSAVPAAPNDEDEVAAVIAAAGAMMAPAGVSYRARRITPGGRNGHTEWAAAAIRQNTMPF